MSKADIETFYTHLHNNPALLQQLTAGAPDTGTLIQRAMVAAQSLGLSFDREEASDWIQQTFPPANQELSDIQLEVVAGGKEENKNNQPPRPVSITLMGMDSCMAAVGFTKPNVVPYPEDGNSPQ